MDASNKFVKATLMRVFAAIPIRYMVGQVLLFLFLHEVYSPALSGPFLFDDRYLPFLRPGFAEASLSDVISGVRPLLMVTYWANTRLFGLDTYWFHFVNLLLHAAAGVCVWFIATKLTQDKILSAFCTLVFLFHPLQSESVAYIAGRSEVAASVLFLAAWAIFLWRKQPAISIGESLLVMVFYVMAVLTKENMIVLGAVLLLTDYFFNPGFSLDGMKKNWKFYAALLAGSLAVLPRLLSTLKNSLSAGFNLGNLTPIDYLLTQVRSLWVYVRLCILPLQQNLDYDMPISRSLFDYGAGLCLLSWLVLAAIAWNKRKEWPLASFGFFLFLVLLAPTSSFLPIRDVLVERRMYMAVFALSLIAVEFLRRWKTTPATLTALTAIVSVALMTATYQRNAVWSSALALWSDTAAKSPNKARPHFHLALAHFQKGHCLEASGVYSRAFELKNADDRSEPGDLRNWSLALACSGQPGLALTRLEEANRIRPSAHSWALMGMIRGQSQQYEQGLVALAEAEKLDPSFSMLYIFRGDILLARNDLAAAIASYQTALRLTPNYAAAARRLHNALDVKASKSDPKR